MEAARSLSQFVLPVFMSQKRGAFPAWEAGTVVKQKEEFGALTSCSPDPAA